MKKFIITESEKNDIRKMYGLIKEQGVTLPTTVTDSYTATDCDELHAFQGTGGKVIGNMNVTVGNKLLEIYNSGVNPKVTGVKVEVQGMTVTWTVTIDKSNDGMAWVGFTSRGAGCNNDVKDRAESAAAGNDMQTAKTRIESTYGEQGIEIEMINDYFYNGGKNSFRQVFYRYTKPKSNPPKGGQQQKAQTQPTNTQTTNNEQVSIKGSSLDDLRTKVKSQTQGLSIDTESANLDVNNLTVTFKKGDEPIHNLSVIWSNVSRDELNLVYQKVSKSNKVEFLGDVKELNSGGTTIYCLLIAIY
jgi:hypothetical protein